MPAGRLAFREYRLESRASGLRERSYSQLSNVAKQCATPAVTHVPKRCYLDQSDDVRLVGGRLLSVPSYARVVALPTSEKSPAREYSSMGALRCTKHWERKKL